MSQALGVGFLKADGTPIEGRGTGMSSAYQMLDTQKRSVLAI